MNRILVGDCRDGMRQLIAEGVKVQTCVTSPPYWGLRDYGTAQWEGGDLACDHMMQVGGVGKSTLGEASGGHAISPEKQRESQERQRTPYRDLCGKCGAKRIDRQLGLEATPEQFVANMVEVFRLVRELLADDGTLWLNLGDSYAGGGRGGGSEDCKQRTNVGSLIKAPKWSEAGTIKPKDLVGIPWRVAFALQADGWYLRQDIIWAKPNPMPESVRDRCTKAHEYLFLLSKRERYYYDAEAIKEDCSPNTHERYASANGKEFGMSNWARGEGPHDAVSRSRDVGVGRNARPRKAAPNGSGIKNNESFDRAMAVMPERRNKRSVWTVATEAYPDAHFATFPSELIKPCILAGSRPGDIVFDPFMGSGTTAMVALELGRQYLGCELNPEYAKLAEQRTKVTVGLPFTSHEPLATSHSLS